jgi:hypothetical protein
MRVLTGNYASKRDLRATRHRNENCVAPGEDELLPAGRRQLLFLRRHLPPKDLQVR